MRFLVNLSYLFLIFSKRSAGSLLRASMHLPFGLALPAKLRHRGFVLALYVSVEQVFLFICTKVAMNDPSSFKHDKTYYWDMKTYILVKMSYRGKNAFGAVVRGHIAAHADLDGKIIEIVTSE